MVGLSITAIGLLTATQDHASMVRIRSTKMVSEVQAVLSWLLVGWLFVMSFAFAGWLLGYPGLRVAVTTALYFAILLSWRSAFVMIGLLRRVSAAPPG